MEPPPAPAHPEPPPQARSTISYPSYAEQVPRGGPPMQAMLAPPPPAARGGMGTFAGWAVAILVFGVAVGLVAPLAFKGEARTEQPPATTPNTPPPIATFAAAPPATVPTPVTLALPVTPPPLAAPLAPSIAAEPALPPIRLTDLPGEPAAVAPEPSAVPPVVEPRIVDRSPWGLTPPAAASAAPPAEPEPQGPAAKDLIYGRTRPAPSASAYPIPAYERAASSAYPTPGYERPAALPRPSVIPAAAATARTAPPRPDGLKPGPKGPPPPIDPAVAAADKLAREQLEAVLK